MSAAPGPRRSPGTIALGTFLLLAALALAGVLAAGDAAPLWLIGMWFLLAAAIALMVGAWVPREARKTGRGGAEATGPSVAQETVPSQVQATGPSVVQATGPSTAEAREPRDER